MSDHAQSPPALVSVIMANKNGARYLKQAVHSVLSQSLTHLELVFVDDASADNSLPLIRDMARNDSRIRVIARSRSGGAATARNDAIESIKSEWIAICDSDDVMHPSRIAQLLAFAKVQKADLASDDAIHFSHAPMDAPKTVLGLKQNLHVTEYRALDLAVTNAIGYLKPLIRRNILADRPYRENLAIGEDYQLYLELVMNGAHFWQMPAAMYLYRRQPGSLSFRSAPDQIEAQITALWDILPTNAAPPNSNDALREALLTRINSLEWMRTQETFAASLKAKQVGLMAKLALTHPAPVLNWCHNFAQKRFSAVKKIQAHSARDIELKAPVDWDGNALRRYIADLCYQASQGPISLVANDETDLSTAWMVPAATGLKGQAAHFSHTPRPLI